MQSSYDTIKWYRFTADEKARITAKIKTALAKEKTVKQAWIFGSFTRRNVVRDIDIAIETNPNLSFKQYLDLSVKIERQVGMPIDIVNLAEAPKPLQASIAKANIKIK
ncbi:MAG: nucleotidyltransferase domain-containing protein [Candidatus Bathyarchaeia archaeon]